MALDPRRVAEATEDVLTSLVGFTRELGVELDAQLLMLSSWEVPTEGRARQARRVNDIAQQISQLGRAMRTLACQGDDARDALRELELLVEF